jgi:hypothetical protein
MFNKIISNLPFSPSLIGQVSFYINRMKAEESLRRLGIVFVVLAMTVQSFAVISPPRKSQAYSSDYIINGLNTRDDILRAWDNKTSDKDVAAIYGRFGLTRDDIAGLPMNPNATVVSSNADYWTIGRSSISAVSKADQIKQKYKDNEIALTAGGSTVYLRQLRAWDIKNPSNSYSAFEGTKNGKKFWILKTCGNFTQAEQPPLATPGLELRKTIEGPTILKPGDNAVFRFEYRNPVAGSPAVTNIKFSDVIDPNFEIIEPTNITLDANRSLNLTLPDATYSPDFKTFLLIRVRFKAGLADGTKSCNAAKLSASNAPDAWSGGDTLCLTLLNPKKCVYNPSIDDGSQCVEPVLVCELTNTVFNKTTKEATLKTITKANNDSLITIKEYRYTFGDGTNTTVKSPLPANEAKHTYKAGSYSANVVVAYSYKVNTVATEKLASCGASIEATPDQPLSKSKVVTNMTQKLTPQQTETKAANSDDVIEYNLVVTNSYDYDRSDVNITDNIADVLEYAELDNAFLKQQGGAYDSQNKTITWPAETVKAKSTVTKAFRVTVKKNIPATNQPSTVSTAYDCKISNKFGNQTDVSINCPKVKTAEYINTSLPKTGPGSSLAIGFTAAFIFAYFYSRARLLGKEMNLVRNEYVTSGGV